MTWRLGPVDQRTGGGRPPSAGALAAPGLLGSPLLVTLALFVAMLMIAAAPASAKQVWQQAGSIDGTATPSGSFDGPGRLAIDQSAKVLYVLDQGHDALLKYDISGASPILENFSALGSPELDGAGTADLTPQGKLGLTVNADIAVDNSGGATDGFIYVATGTAGLFGGQVDVFDASGTFKYQFGASPTSVAVDQGGRLYVAKFNFADLHVDRYNADAVSATKDTTFSLLPSSIGVNQIAIDADDKFYLSTSAAMFGAPGIKRYGPSGAEEASVAPFSATAMAVNRSNNRLYVDRGSIIEEYGTSGTALTGQIGRGDISNSSGLAVGLTTGLIYASDVDGHIRWFNKAIIPDVTASDAKVNGTAAILRGTVNPDGVPLITCEFQWGPEGVSGYSSAPIPCTPNPASNSNPVPVSTKLSGLQAGAYHYRLHTSNANGVVNSKNGSFRIGACKNEGLRVGSSAALGDCRAYEMVSPAEKGANTLITTTAGGAFAYPSSSGNQVYLQATTPFIDPASGRGTQAVSVRSPFGWRTRNFIPKDCISDASGLVGGYNLAGLSMNFSKAILTTVKNGAGDPQNCADNDHAGVDLYSVGTATAGPLTWISHRDAPKTVDVTATYAGSSFDASHILFSTPEKFSLPVENGRSAGSGLYDRTQGRTVPVGLQSDGSLVNPCGASIAGAGDASAFGAISANGNVIFFTSGSNAAVPGCSPTTDDGGQLYARINGIKTVLLSASQRSTPETRKIPKFLGATDDGKHVFFTSTERLTDQATPGGGLYEYDLTNALTGTGSGRLTFMTPSIDGNAANVTALVGTSDNGAVAYITATGVLDTGGVAGKQNIYRITTSGAKFMVTLTAISLNTNALSVSPDGSKVVYLDRSADGTQQLRLFNASTPAAGVSCVSCPEDGTSANGDARLFGALSGSRPRSLGQSRYVTDDGRVFFNSTAQLSRRDRNQHYDVYEYDHGSQELISSGSSSQDSLLIGVGPNGRDVFFATNDSLVGQDFDNGDQDIYDARVGGGFPPPPPPVIRCAGDECQPQERTPVLGVPGSVAFVAPWSPALRAVPAPKAKPKKVSVKRPKTVRGKTKVRLSVKAPEAGRIRVSGSGLRRAKMTAKKAKTYRVTVKLSKRSKRILKRKHRVKVRATVRFTPKHGKRSRVRVHVTFKQGKRHGKAKRRSHDSGHHSAGKGGR